MSRGTITTLRDMVPLRPLTRFEALALAERQARCLLRLTGVTSEPVPEGVITDVPKVAVRRLAPFPVSGATYWSAGSWRVGLNGAEPATRQRFSLAHEFKHILDHPFADLIYRSLDEPERSLFIEQVCDYFAGCLLVPAEWLARAAATDANPAALAARFEVSQAAIHTRLNQCGLTAPTRRCNYAPGLGFEPSHVIRRRSHHRHPVRRTTP